MSGLRLAFVTRRFWPLVGENELHLAQLTEGLLERGHRPIVITPKYGKHWPGQVCVRGVPVVRLPYPPPRTWGNVRFSFAVSRWLQQRQSELDAVVVSGSHEDALTSLGAVRASQVAVVVQDELGLEVDAAPRRFGAQLLRRLAGCDAFVRFPRGDETSRAEEPQPWMSPERTHALQLGVRGGTVRTPASKAAARGSLAEVNHDLAVAPEAPVVLCLSPMVADAQLESVVRAWRTVQTRWPDARLWIVGDGPTRSSLFTLLSDLNLKYRIVLPGTFDDWADLLQACDLVLQTGHAAAASLAERQAMAAGVPVLVVHSARFTAPTPNAPPGGFTDSAGRVILGSGAEGQLASHLVSLLENPAAGVRLGEQGRQVAEVQYRFQTMLDDYERLLQNLVQQRRSRSAPPG